MPNNKNSTPSIAYSFTVRAAYENRVGVLAKITETISRTGGDLGAVDLIVSDSHTMTRDLTIYACDEAHVETILNGLQALPEVRILNTSDKTFLLHLHGKIAIVNKVPVTTREALSMAYTPGVARVCMAIAKDPEKVHQLTIKSNAVAVVTDGTAVLGLGDIGPAAAMPVMEGKAMLFKEFANIDAYPICLSTQDPDEIVETIVRIATGFGGINLEDISAPRCFEIEEKLQARLDIPVFHDDQHGTAIVVLAGLMNAIKLSHRKMPDLRVVIVGAGAAGVAITKILLSAGVTNIVACDRKGILTTERDDLNSSKVWLAEHTNQEKRTGPLADALHGADVFIGVSGPGLITREMLKTMAPDPLIFALANPDPEISPHEAADIAAVVATGRSDYPNQINNVLAFPGLFRGALDVRANRITEGMKVAAAHAIAECVAESNLSPEYIIPSVFDANVPKRVAAAVAAAAVKDGVARKKARVEEPGSVSI